MTDAMQPAARAEPDAFLPSLGAELEMAVIDRTGASACVGDGYFLALAALRRAHGPVALTRQGGAIIGLSSGIGVNGIDNGFNLLETAHAPVPPATDGLSVLARRMAADLDDVLAALATQGLTLTALAQHPTAGIAPGDYARRVAPKSIYRYLNDQRGWHHAVGIDAKAQNGPTTEVSPDHAIAALNLLLTASPVFIALFANSPFEGGAPTGLMDTRMTLWPRMVAGSRVAADRARCGLPPRLFRSIGDYWAWTFGPGSVAQAMPLASGDYKGDSDLWVVGDGRLSVPQLFRQPGVPARRLGDGRPGRLVPTAAHFAYLQWSNFLDFRLRFVFADPPPERQEIAAAFDEPGLFDGLFASRLSNLYIENRCAGATFPDAALRASAGDDLAGGAMIAPAALQAGLVSAARRDQAAFLARWPLSRIRLLREHAIRHALGRPGARSPDAGSAAALQALCDEVLDLSEHHLLPAGRPALRYARWVRQTGLTGAYRALAATAGCQDLNDLSLRLKVG